MAHHAYQPAGSPVLASRRRLAAGDSLVRRRSCLHQHDGPRRAARAGVRLATPARGARIRRRRVRPVRVDVPVRLPSGCCPTGRASTVIRGGRAHARALAAFDVHVGRPSADCSVRHRRVAPGAPLLPQRLRRGQLRPVRHAHSQDLRSEARPCAIGRLLVGARRSRDRRGGRRAPGAAPVPGRRRSVRPTVGAVPPRSPAITCTGRHRRSSSGSPSSSRSRCSAGG